jgi:hypothetical protein
LIRRKDHKESKLPKGLFRPFFFEALGIFAIFATYGVAWILPLPQAGRVTEAYLPY